MTRFLQCLAAFGLSASTAANGQTLEFSGITKDTTLASSFAISCNGSGRSQVCKLVRTSFADIPIEYSLVLLNRTTKRVSFISISFDDLFFSRALEALTAKYGEPSSDSSTEKTNSQGGPYTFRVASWNSFEDRGRVELIKLERTASLQISFPDNQEEPRPPKVDF